MTKHHETVKDAGDRPVFEITQEMIEAASARLNHLAACWLEECPYSIELLAEELLRAALYASSARMKCKGMACEA